VPELFHHVWQRLLPWYEHEGLALSSVMTRREEDGDPRLLVPGVEYADLKYSDRMFTLLANVTHLLRSTLGHALSSSRVQPERCFVARVDVGQLVLQAHLAHVEDEVNQLLGVFDRRLLADGGRNSEDKAVAVQEARQPSFAHLKTVTLVSGRQDFTTYREAVLGEDFLGLEDDESPRHALSLCSLLKHPVGQFAVFLRILQLAPAALESLERAAPGGSSLVPK